MASFLDENPWALFTAELNRYMPRHKHSVEWWEEAARRATRFFPGEGGKERFMTWVRASFGSEENRFAASVCWDIVKLKEMPTDGENGA